jgi:hypothetical protein
MGFDGRSHQLRKAQSEPKPIQRPPPPFVIGGGGELLMLRVVARYAEIRNHTGNLEEFTRKVAILREFSAEVGRNLDEITPSWQLVLQLENLALADIKSFGDAGASHFVLVLPSPHEPGVVTRIANEIIAKLRW